MQILGYYCDPSTIRGFGKGNCAAFYGALQYVILAPLGSSLTPAQVADLMASLKARNINDSYDQRFYLLGEWKTVEMAYQDATTTTWGNGSTSQMRAAVAAWRLITDDGGTCFATALQSIDNLQDTFGLYYVTNENMIWGTRVPQEDGTVNWGPVRQSRLTAETPMVFTYDNPDQYVLYAEMANKDDLFVNGLGVSADVETLVTNMPNIQDVYLSALTQPNGSGTFDMALAAGCGTINLADSGLTSLFANVARYRAFNFATGAAITITSVAQNASKSGLTVDLDSSDTDYPTSGGLIGIELVAVSTLAAAGLEYYESVADNVNYGINKYLLVTAA